MLEHIIIFVNILQWAYRNTDICFLFEKYESVQSEICSEFSFTMAVEECRFNIRNFS